MEKSAPKAPYEAPEIQELGSAALLTLGQTGPSVDADAQKAPQGPTPSGRKF